MKIMSRENLSNSSKRSLDSTISYKKNDMTSGVQTFENGNIYTGEFLDGKKHGKGVLKTLSNRTYDNH